MKTIRSRRRLSHVKVNNSGFTLIEIIIAMAIVSIAILAFTVAIDGAAKLTNSQRDRLMAYWVASNQMAMKRVYFSGKPFKNRVETGIEKMGGKSWFYRIEIKKHTQKPILQHISVSVYENADSPALVSLESALNNNGN